METYTNFSFAVGGDSDDELEGLQALGLSSELTNYTVAFRAMTNENVAVADASLVQSMNKGMEGAMIRDYQAALKVAAEER